MNNISHLLVGLSLVVSAAAHAETVTSTGDDVQVLQAWRAEAIDLSIASCSGNDPEPGQQVLKDCSAQGVQVSKPSWSDRSSPALNDWLLPVTNYHGLVYSYYSYGHLVEIRALVKRGVIESPVFTGIGFYYSNMLGQKFRFVPKSELHIVSGDDVSLKGSGEKAVVLRFVLSMPGQQGDSGTGWSMNSVDFKPFAQYEADGQVFQVWDKVASNYRIYRMPNGGGRAQIVSFDRQNELLKQ